MRKNLLALSIAATIGSLAGTANATVIANTAASGLGVSGSGIPAAATTLTPTNTGVGHILLVPYFSTQGSNASLLNIVNTDEVNGKAVKLRYRAAANSDDVFDITIYLSPSDMWSASVTVDAAGLSALTTNDTSCTLPSKQDIKDAGGKFKTNRVRAAAASETREGYIEILNSADIPPTLVDATGARTATANPLFNAIKHTAGVPTCASAVMDLQENALNDTVGSPNRWNTRGYTFPTGRLMANWTVANVAKKAVTTGEAVAVKATPSNVIDVPGAGNLVWFPQTTEVVAPATAANLTADPLLSGGAIKAAMYDFPDLSTPYTGGGTPNTYADLLSRMIETSSVTNEFITSGDAAAGTDFATDWVFTMPTRRYAVGVSYAGTGSLVFNSGLTRHFTSANVSLSNFQACVDTGSLRAWDREENTRTTFVISPSTNVRFCGEASVLTFNNKPSVLGAQIAVNAIDTKFSEGWMRVNTPGANAGLLPVIGFSSVTYAGGALGGTWAHRVRPSQDVNP